MEFIFNIDWIIGRINCLFGGERRLKFIHLFFAWLFDIHFETQWIGSAGPAITKTVQSKLCPMKFFSRFLIIWTSATMIFSNKHGVKKILCYCNWFEPLEGFWPQWTIPCWENWNASIVKISGTQVPDFTVNNHRFWEER